jgi:hypothetical protein
MTVVVSLVIGSTAACLCIGEAHGQGADPCVVAGALIDARLPIADKAHWFKTLETCSPANGQTILATVRESIRRRELDELELGSDAERDGELRTAASHFEAALAFEPADSAAADHLKLVREALGHRIDHEAAVLLAGGKIDDALKLLGERSSRAADERNTWFSLLDFRARMAANAQFFAEAAVLIGAFLWVMFRFLRRFTTRHVLVLRDFANNSLAPGIEQAVQAMLTNLSRGSGVSASAQLRVTRPLEEVPLPVDISKVLPESASWMQVIPGLIARIFPRRTLPISGVLHQDAVKGAGVTIHVVNKEGIHLSETFWQSQFGAVIVAKKSQSAHYALAEYVAIWLLFEFSSKGFALLGTTQWRAYALFRAGVNASAESAKGLYLSALRVDESIHAARLNIALLAETKQRPFVADLFECAAQNAGASDATRYQARYSLASLRYDLDDHADRAIAEMATLFKSLLETCETFNLKEDLRNRSSEYYQNLTRGQSAMPTVGAGTSAGAVTAISAKIDVTTQHPHTELEQYIEYLLPIAWAMSLGLSISKDHKNLNALKALQAIGRVDQSPRVRYNLACSYALVAQGLSAELPKELTKRTPAQVKELHLYLKQGLESLGLALWLNPEIGKKVRDDKALTGLRTSAEVVDGETVSVSVTFERIVSTYMGPLPLSNGAGAMREGSGGPALVFTDDG